MLKADIIPVMVVLFIFEMSVFTLFLTLLSRVD